MVAPDPTPPTAEQYKILNYVLMGDCVLYCLTILLLWHNSYFYLYKQKKWRVLFMIVFYVLS